MAKPLRTFESVVATANDLATGAVVFRAPDGGWTNDIGGAEIAETETQAADLLARACADHAACRVVEPVLIEVRREAGFVRPASLRELIRASGPTVPVPSSP
jgi:hypothetical protein